MPTTDLAVIRAEIEVEREWREKEIRLLKNFVEMNENEESRKRLRKALVVMLYAHFEGICKTILCLYVDFLNNQNLKIGAVDSAIAAASLTDFFKALKNPNSKHQFFKKPYPDDSELHGFARDKEFIESISEYNSLDVRLNSEYIVNVESNLKPAVLKKIVFQLGLDYLSLRQVDGGISKLLNFRNEIAHGVRKEGLEKSDCELLEKDVRFVVDELVSFVSKAITHKEYLKI
jgi:hypothetical protein